MQFLKLKIYLIILCTCFFGVYCDEEDDAFDDVTELNALEKINSFFYQIEEVKNEEDSNNPTTQESIIDQYFKTVQPCNCEKSDERGSQEAVFYKRMIAVLLSNLVMQKVDNKLVGTLNMEVSPSQYKYLSNFVEGQGSIREVDRILDDVIRKSAYPTSYYIAELSYYFNISAELLMQYALVIKEHWEITIILLIVLSSYMVLRRRRWSMGLVIFLLLSVIFIMSFFITWWQLIQEAEIKLMAAQAQFAEMPIACQPHKMDLWDKVVTWFSHTNACEKYYETLMMNPRLQVTPAFALTHFLTKTVFHPVSYFGIVLSEFIDNVTSKMHWFYSIPVTIILILGFCVCMILWPFFLTGGSFNLGIGPFFRVGIKGRANRTEQERIDRIHEDTSPKKLKVPKRLKQIVFEEDPAGGDAGVDERESDKELEQISKVDKKRKGDGDC